MDRLNIMKYNADGFKIAEADLERRGPGDFFGDRQSGEFSFACTSLADIALIPETDKIVKAALADREGEKFAPLFKAADIFLERNSDGKTVN